MRRRTKGQSLVETALLMPLMLIVLFGIIDFGWYVYGYATIYMAARNGAEKATMLPPKEPRVGVGVAPDRNDVCVSSIYKEIRDTAPLFPALVDTPGAVEISYPSGKRMPGEPIQVKVSYNVVALTPLWRMVPLGNAGTFRVVVTTRRSIEVLGDNPGNKYSPNLTACS